MCGCEERLDMSTMRMCVWQEGEGEVGVVGGGRRGEEGGGGGKREEGVGVKQTLNLKNQDNNISKLQLYQCLYEIPQSLQSSYSY